MLDAPTRLQGIDAAELDTIRGLFHVLAAKQPRNMLRSVYFDGKAPLKDLGISLPPQLRSMEVVLGWPEKAVRTLAHRNVFDGFVHPEQTEDPFGLSEILVDNDFELELPQAIVSTYKHSCSFLTVTRGDVQSGDPDVLILPRSAEWSSATWDKRRRRVSAALAVTSADEAGEPTSFTVYLPDAVLMFTRSPGGVWSTDRMRSRVGEVLVEPLRFDPQLDRPFGRSRISRAVMSITDRGIRTVARSEVGAEFFTAPQRYVLGADEDAWSGTNKWQAIVGRFLALSKDEDGDTPSVGQFQQMTMQPHMDQLRSIAAQFASETALDLSQLGIVQDNPSSAEAIYAAKEPLIIEARAANRVFGASLVKVAQKAVMLRDGMTSLSPELRRLMAKWTPPEVASPVSRAQAMQLEIQSLPWVAETTVALEGFGHSAPEIERMQSEKRRAGAGAVLSLLAARGQGDDVEAGS
jgi:hypothetical protein